MTEQQSRPRAYGALVEQATGVLVHRYRVDPETARRVLEAWAHQLDEEVATTAFALVHEVCRDGAEPRSDARVVRWLREQLDRDLVAVPAPRTPLSQTVTVHVDQSYSSLDAVIAASREAARRGVPLEITSRDDEEGIARAHLMQRLDLAVEIARAVEPGLVVRLAPEPARESTRQR